MAKLNFKKLINELNNDEIIIKNELNEIIKINKNDLKLIENDNDNYKNDIKILSNNKLSKYYYNPYMGNIIIEYFVLNELNENDENEIYNELLLLLLNNDNYKIVINKYNDDDDEYENFIGVTLNDDYYYNFVI